MFNDSVKESDVVEEAAGAIMREDSSIESACRAVSNVFGRKLGIFTGACRLSFAKPCESSLPSKFASMRIALLTDSQKELIILARNLNCAKRKSTRSLHSYILV